MARLDFKGKQLVWNHHLAVPYHELVPQKGKSLTDKVSLNDNLIVHGDNLLALKALLPTYAGKVKCIYIDPPYNTGNEGWAYNDNVNSPMIRDWLGKTVDRDDLTRHDKWLCMMTPRLKLLRDLLRDDGVIFVSIDDNEVAHLRMLMDEVFGEEHFIGMFKWNRVTKAPSLSESVRTKYEYVVAYYKQNRVALFGKSSYNTQGPLWHLPNKRTLLNFPARSIRVRQSFSKGDYGGTYKVELLDDLLEHDGYNRNAVRIRAHSAWGQSRINQYLEDGFTFEIKKSPKTVYTTLVSEGNFIAPSDLITKEESGVGTNTDASDAMKKFDIPFDFPKPVSLVKYLIRMVTHNEPAIILDSFAGSGTTAHAVLEQNMEDGGNRKFILVELEDDVVDKITAERVRRVIKGVPNAKDEKLKKGLGGSFSYFNLGKPIEMQSILSGERLPSYVDLARYVFYTSTGEEFDESQVGKKPYFIGESEEYEVYLMYEPDVDKLKDLALTLKTVEEMGAFWTEGKKRLVFAPTKYLDQSMLDQHRIDFAQLPFEIYELASTS